MKIEKQCKKCKNYEKESGDCNIEQTVLGEEIINDLPQATYGITQDCPFWNEESPI